MAVSGQIEKTHNVTESMSDSFDVALDVSVAFIGLLKNGAHFSSVPGISEAARIAVSITEVVANARNNKIDFKRLAEDVIELVYTIVRAHGEAENLPPDLNSNLRQLVRTLTSILKFAEKGVRRNFFIAMFRCNVDAQRIQDFREKIRQAMRVFHLQSNISLREAIHELRKEHVELRNELQTVRLAAVMNQDLPLPEIDQRVPLDNQRRHSASL